MPSRLLEHRGRVYSVLSQKRGKHTHVVLTPYDGISGPIPGSLLESLAGLYFEHDDPPIVYQSSTSVRVHLWPHSASYPKGQEPQIPPKGWEL